MRFSAGRPHFGPTDEEGRGMDRRNFVLGAGGAAVGLAAADNAMGEGADADQISHTAASIHQEVAFAAKPSRVYVVLTDATAFDRVVRLSAAMTSVMSTSLGTAPTQIDARPGGAFVLFGGYITGRNIELVPDTRIVQAWRVGSWDAGLYSIARFQLSPSQGGTRLVFDHTGFPDRAAEHLAQGWHANYWQPLAKVLAGA
jgi:activator of HSP90 ATPase